MLASRASLPARQAARAVLHANASPAQPLILLLHLRRPQQQRLYAKMRSPTVSKSARLAQRQRQSQSQSQSSPVFSHLDIPPVDVWREFKKHQGLGDLTPEQCLKTITDYCGLAIHGTSSWKAALETDYNIDPYALHYTALPLVIRGSGRVKYMGAHMLVTASELGYTPSTLMLMSVFLPLGKDKVASSAFSKATAARFDRLLQTEKNPDAFTLQGLLLLQDGHSTSALRYFDKAIDAARSLPPSATGDKPGLGGRGGTEFREPRWFFERACHQKRGEILLRQNRTGEALDSFRIAALELDLADGYAELAKLMPAAPKQMTYMMKAAQGGNFDACGLLALRYADLANANFSRLPAITPLRALRTRVNFRDMAYEWAAVDPDFKKRDELQAQVVEKTGEITRLARQLRGGPITRTCRWLWSRFRKA